MWYALISGLLSFLSPCVVPVIPIYLGMLGSTVKNKWATLIFCGGIITTLTLMGMISTSIGIFLHQHVETLRLVFGILIILFGLQTLDLINISILNRTFRLDFGDKYRFKPFLMGVSFAVAFSPCTGPMLGSILMLAASSDTMWYGGFLLFIYSLGFCIPFIILSQLTQCIKPINNWISNNLKVVEFISGLFLILFGIAMIFNIISI